MAADGLRRIVELLHCLTVRSGPFGQHVVYIGGTAPSRFQDTTKIFEPLTSIKEFNSKHCRVLRLTRATLCREICLSCLKLSDAFQALTAKHGGVRNWLSRHELPCFAWVVSASRILCSWGTE